MNPATLDHGEYVALTVPVFDIEAERFHVNDTFAVGTGEDGLAAMLKTLAGRADGNATHGVVLQRADASDEWVGLLSAGDTVETAFHMAGFDADHEVVDSPDGVEVTPE